MIFPEWKQITDGGAQEIVSTRRHSGINEIFNEQEKMTIFWVIDSFKLMSTWDMVTKSNAHIKAETREHEHMIGFQENAFLLEGV
ncbi:hypothetical protein A0256_01015 [Mucilaginibacter sp. PAMC 26640]|nr:hypothetical protein A0256_01015 [Mucilaginibacter sp. PAMC 26640]